jgi:hypothetical protein
MFLFKHAFLSLVELVSELALKSLITDRVSLMFVRNMSASFLKLFFASRDLVSLSFESYKVVPILTFVIALVDYT